MKYAALATGAAAFVALGALVAVAVAIRSERRDEAALQAKVVTPFKARPMAPTWNPTRGHPSWNVQ